MASTERTVDTNPWRNNSESRAGFASRRAFLMVDILGAPSPNSPFRRMLSSSSTFLATSPGVARNPILPPQPCERRRTRQGESSRRARERDPEDRGSTTKSPPRHSAPAGSIRGPASAVPQIPRDSTDAALCAHPTYGPRSALDPNKTPWQTLAMRSQAGLKNYPILTRLGSRRFRREQTRNRRSKSKSLRTLKKTIDSPDTV